MIAHIFRKDWHLIGKPALAVACIQFAYTAIQIRQTLLGGTPVLQQLGQVLIWLWLMAGTILIIAIVQQDALPGTRQDWLTRPIPRRSVLIEKVLFITAMVQGPAIGGDLLQGCVYGFPFRQTAAAALARAVVLFVAMLIPALLLGAVTESVTQAMVLAVVAIFGVFAFTMVAIGTAGGYGHQFDPTGLTGEEWLPNTARFVLFLLGAAIILAVQYRTRNTLRARLHVAALLLLLLVSQLTPWKPVFAMQQKLSPEPGASRSIALAWRPGAVPLEPAPKGRFALPLLVTGLPADSILKADKSEVTISDRSGRVLYSGPGGDLQIAGTNRLPNETSFNHTLALPAGSGGLLRGREIQAHALYSLTLFKLGEAFSLQAVGDNQRLPGWGWCRTRANEDDTAIEVSCVQMGKGPTCATVFLENPASGKRNPENTSCSPNYAPYSDRPIPDAVARFRLVLPFHDRSGLIQYPLEASQLGGARVVIRMFVPQDHFARELTSPLMKPS